MMTRSRFTSTTVLAVCASCTIFDGLRVSPPAVDAGAVTDGSPRDVSAEPRGFVSLEDGVRICSLAVRCEKEVGGVSVYAEISRKLGIPLMSYADGTSLSACLQWLSAPAPGNRERWAEALRTLAALPVTVACSDVALVCDETQSGCRPTASADCGAPSGTLDPHVTCEEAGVLVCGANGASSFVLDCDAVDASCHEVHSTAFCLPRERECAPFDRGTDECDDLRVTVCFDGRRVSVDCRAIGFDAGCSGYPLARCR